MENYERFIDYYAVLDVSRNASEEEIKTAYRQLAKEYHPDKHSGESKESIDYYEHLFKCVQDAYEHLGNESKNNNRAEYNILYDKYHAEKRARAEEFQRRRKNAENSDTHREQSTNNHQQRQKHTSSTSHTSSKEKQPSKKATESRLKSAGEDIKMAWKEVREEEKKYPFFTRHKTLNGKVHRAMYKEDGNIGEKFIYALANGTLHITAELVYQLEKLTHITKDTIPKYVIRNRVLAGTAALIMLISGASIDSKKEIPTDNTLFSEQAADYDEDITIDDVTYKEEQQKPENLQQETPYIAIRKYSIQPDDTLLKLAINANTTVEHIMKYNDIESADLIRSGETIYVPYVIECEDLKYATVVTYFEAGTDLKSFAEKFKTDETSIYELNKEAFEDGVVISSTLLVPTFTPKIEIEKAKETKAYTYSNNH